jgi:hypothetical protein
VPLTADQLRRDLAIPDLSDLADGRHAIQLVAGAAAGALAAARNRNGTSCRVRWCRGPRIVPPALRDLAAEPRQWPAGDVLLACAGIAYRRDAIDWQHTGTPHQLDLWRISRRELTIADLGDMIAALLDAIVPGLPSRQIPRVHPYTIGGRQVGVLRHGTWVEVFECGLAHPAVLGGAGLHGCTGLALGMGLDRMLMLRKHIPDIRLLRSADLRIAGQMLDLRPYRPVSSQPAIRSARTPTRRRTWRSCPGHPARTCRLPRSPASAPGRISATCSSASCCAAWTGRSPTGRRTSSAIASMQRSTAARPGSGRRRELLGAGRDDPAGACVHVHRAAAQEPHQREPGPGGQLGRERRRRRDRGQHRDAG